MLITKLLITKSIAKLCKVALSPLLICSSAASLLSVVSWELRSDEAIAEVSKHSAMPKAIANIFDAQGKLIGTASFKQVKQGVQINLKVQNLAMGAHMVHIHERGKCDAPDFSTAGNHFDPAPHMDHQSKPQQPKHDDSKPMHSHQHNHKPAGDLPNIMVNADGKGNLVAVLPNLTLGMGANSLLKSGGTAILIHAGADGKSTIPNVDYKTRIACGVISAK